MRVRKSLELFGGRGVGQDDGGVGEIGFAGEGIAGVGEEFEIGQGRPVRNAADVEIGVLEDGALRGYWARRPGTRLSSAIWKRKRISSELEKGRMSETGTGTMVSSCAEALSVWGSGVELTKESLRETCSVLSSDRGMPL